MRRAHPKRAYAAAPKGASSQRSSCHAQRAVQAALPPRGAAVSAPIAAGKREALPYAPLTPPCAQAPPSRKALDFSHAPVPRRRRRPKALRRMSA